MHVLELCGGPSQLRLGRRDPCLHFSILQLDQPHHTILLYLEKALQSFLVRKPWSHHTQAPRDEALRDSSAACLPDPQRPISPAHSMPYDLYRLAHR